MHYTCTCSSLLQTWYAHVGGPYDNKSAMHYSLNTLEGMFQVVTRSKATVFSLSCLYTPCLQQVKLLLLKLHGCQSNIHWV